MARKFSELRSKMSRAARASSEKEFRRLVEEMPLRQLRTARALTQESLAHALGVRQSEISKIESRTDVYLSTLASYIRAMGGELELCAVFPKGEIVRINQFSRLSSKPFGTRNKKKSA
jgi:DNA-binding XRE family transcriptional regulator